MKVWSREDGALMVVGFAPDTLVKYYFSMEKPSLLMFLMGSIVVFVCNLLLMIFLMLRNARRVEKQCCRIQKNVRVFPVLCGKKALPGFGKKRRRNLHVFSEKCGVLP